MSASKRGAGLPATIEVAEVVVDEDSAGDVDSAAVSVRFGS